MKKIHRQKKGSEFSTFTVRVLNEINDQILQYASRHQISKALAMQELLRKGLDYNSETKKAS